MKKLLFVCALMLSGQAMGQMGEKDSFKYEGLYFEPDTSITIYSKDSALWEPWIENFASVKATKHVPHTMLDMPGGNGFIFDENDRLVYARIVDGTSIYKQGFHNGSAPADFVELFTSTYPHLPHLITESFGNAAGIVMSIRIPNDVTPNGLVLTYKDNILQKIVFDRIEE